jgi:phage shock protein A
MSLFDRIGLLLRSNINSMVSKAEDPEKILNQLLIDMRDQFIQAKQQVAVAIADEKRLYARMTQAQENVTGWEKKAMLAVQAGDDALAQEALNRQQQEVQQATTWKQQWELQKQATEQLRSALLQLNDKIDEAKRKKDLLIARSKRAEAQKTIQNTMAGLNDNSAFDAFGRMSEKVEQVEAEASASAVLAADVSGQTLEDKFKKLEVQQGSTDALAALKAKMGLAAPSASLRQPAQLSAHSDDEFAIPDIGVDIEKVSKP